MYFLKEKKVKNFQKEMQNDFKLKPFYDANEPN